jgi:hypothetical protein
MSTTQSINGDDATSLSAVGENSIINVTGEKANEKTNITRKVYISHDEALRRIIERIGPNEILPNWSTDDLKGLLVQIMR